MALYKCRELLTILSPTVTTVSFHVYVHGQCVGWLQVLKGGHLDIDMSVKSPKGKVLYRESRRQRDTIPLEVSVGTFTFCFGNEFSSLTHKIVHFSMREHQADPRALAREVRDEPIRPGVQTMIEQMMESIHAFATKVNTYVKLLIEPRRLLETRRL